MPKVEQSRYNNRLFTSLCCSVAYYAINRTIYKAVVMFFYRGYQFLLQKKKSTQCHSSTMGDHVRITLYFRYYLTHAFDRVRSHLIAFCLFLSPKSPMELATSHFGLIAAIAYGTDDFDKWVFSFKFLSP